MKAAGYIGVIRSQLYFPDLETSLVERLRFRALRRGLVQGRQVVEARSHIGVVRPQLGFQDLEASLVERLRFRKFTRRFVQQR